MNGKDNPMKFWEHEFGRNVIGYDFASRKVHKGDYGNSNSPYGWDIDEIHPGMGEEYANQQIINIATNRTKANRTSFEIDGTRYQVQKMTTAKKNGNEIVDYANHYDGKKYVIVIPDDDTSYDDEEDYDDADDYDD